MRRMRLLLLLPLCDLCVWLWSVVRTAFPIRILSLLLETEMSQWFRNRHPCTRLVMATTTTTTSTTINQPLAWPSLACAVGLCVCALLLPWAERFVCELAGGDGREEEQTIHNRVLIKDHRP